jgi:hypothetical protein
MGMIARVFPRRTAATPTDDLAFVGEPPLWHIEADEVRVSCVFTWDKPEALRLSNVWRARGYRVDVGGPAFGDFAGEFEPGMYLADGMTITSRGCIRKCGFCFVPTREGALRTIAIKPGYNVLDNNLLACPRPHIEAVLDMLETQKHPAQFTGGLDARLLEDWFAKRLGEMRVDIAYTAYDADGERRSVVLAIARLREAGLTQRKVACYVLSGFAGDTIGRAEARCEDVCRWGATPFAMVYRSAEGEAISREWRAFARRWTRPAIIFSDPARKA